MSVDITDEQVEAMNSNEKEKVAFKKKSVKARGYVEKWLDDLQAEMISTLKFLMKQAYEEYGTPNCEERNTFVKTHYGQIVATIA